MKFKYYYLLFLPFLFINCKKEISATVKLKIELGNKYSSEYPDLTQLTIYRNGKFFKKYMADKMISIDHDITIPKIPGGKYQFEYQNFFQQRIIKTLVVDDSKIYTISINPDYSDYKQNFNKSFIRKLRNGDSLKMNFESRGCFHSGKDSLLIENKDGEYLLKIDKKEIKLVRGDLDFLERIECELYELPKNGSCTTSDFYTLIFKGKKVKFIDGTCNWNAWSNIYQKFILKEKNGR